MHYPNSNPTLIDMIMNDVPLVTLIKKRKVTGELIMEGWRD